MADLFSMLAEAEARPRGAFNDAISAAEAVGSYINAWDSQRKKDRSRKLESFFDSAIPTKTAKRILPGVKGDVTYGQLSALGSSGVASLLKDPSGLADIKGTVLLASGGDPVKASKLMEIFSRGQNDDEDDGLKINAATVNAARVLKPKEISGISDVPALNAYVDNLTAELKTDIDEDRRFELQGALDAANKRLAYLGGVNIPRKSKPKPATAPPTPVAPTPVKEKGALDKLLEALMK